MTSKTSNHFQYSKLYWFKSQTTNQREHKNSCVDFFNEIYINHSSFFVLKGQRLPAVKFTQKWKLKFIPAFDLHISFMSLMETSPTKATVYLSAHLAFWSFIRDFFWTLWWIRRLKSKHRNDGWMHGISRQLHEREKSYFVAYSELRL